MTATVGTTLAPWGLAFIQSYAVDKRLGPKDLVLERIDVVTGAVMTGVIGLFVIVACAATLHADGRSMNSATDAAAALQPLAGSLAATLFGVGFLGAGLLAASILPLSTAYSVGEAISSEAALDDPFRDAPIFYGTYAAVVVTSVAVVLVPGVPLVPILYLTQALNAVLLLPLLIFIYGISRDRELMGAHANGRWGALASAIAIGFLTLCLAALAVAALT